MQMFQPGINLIAVTGINETGPVAVIICTRDQVQEAAEIIVRHHSDTLGLKIDEISLTAKPLMSIARENIPQILAIMQSVGNHRVTATNDAESQSA